LQNMSNISARQDKIYKNIENNHYFQPSITILANPVMNINYEHVYTEMLSSVWSTLTCHRLSSVSAIDWVSHPLSQALAIVVHIIMAVDFMLGQEFKHSKKQKLVFQSWRLWVHIGSANNVRVSVSLSILSYSAIFLPTSAAITADDSDKMAESMHMHWR